jgi:hypothetical protein
MNERATYLLPIKRAEAGDVNELTSYLRWLSERLNVIVVDGSPRDVFEAHDESWSFVKHIVPAPEWRTANGKVWGVLTGVQAAANEKLVIADDDVRYDEASLARILDLLDSSAVVRPQNYFEPLPWHALWDTARSLLNRASGGDWPGTLAVRRSALLRTNGYDGDCLFENLELVRTVKAHGGVESVPLDLFVRRLPSTTGHFISQRVRQAYDEFARPARLAMQLALLPAMLLMLRRPRFLMMAGVATVALAEFGRRRDGGSQVFPAVASLLAPFWLMERAICSWLAVVARLQGGVRYGGKRMAKAATPERELRAKHREVVAA